MSPSAEQLLRLLRLIPLASRPEGLLLADAARLCGVPEAVILSDVQVLADRAWYLPPGSTDDFQILLEADRVHVLAPPAFRRPVRLGLHERLAVSLALRCSGVDEEAARELGAALEAACSLEAEARVAEAGAPAGKPPAPAGEGVTTARELVTTAGEPVTPAGEPVAFLLRRGDSDELHDRVARALVIRHRLEVAYLKEGAAAPERRRLEPWSLLHAEGESYLLAQDLDRRAPRLFRVDRMLEVRVTDQPATAPIELDPTEVSDDGAVRLVADGRPLETAQVWYAPGVARWVLERHPDARVLDDGSLVVHHPIFTDAWIVRRVLQYGTEAEILGPPRLREAMRRVLATEATAE